MGTGTGGRYMSFTRRVGGYRYDGFFFEKMLTGPSHARTRVPAYTRARVQVPRVTDTDRRVRIVPGGFKQTSSCDVPVIRS
jgi:hypothetical protein